MLATAQNFRRIEGSMRFATAFKLTLLAVLIAAFGGSEKAKAEEPVIAIDVLLQPDEIMLDRASEWNRRMREQSLDGFELDAEHAPHVTVIQRYVAAKDLDAVLAAVARTRKEFDVSKLRLHASGLYHIPSGQIGLAGIVITPSDQLKALQKALIDALAPYARTGGDQSAFVPDTSGAPFQTLLLTYVDTFVR